jgi:RHS repeat-associated protein
MPLENVGRETGKNAASSDNSAAPSINLPKGGGAIRGIGEKFAANPVTGTGSMKVPIVTSPGRSGFGPQLSLTYDSGVGNGPFGLGWNLYLPSITRKTDKGLPQYLDELESDVFILSGAEDLVPELQPGGGRFEDTTTDPAYTIQRYLPRIEGLFARIERWTRNADGDMHWRSISKDNILTLYGKDSHSRIADPANPKHIFSWLICETRDDKGNAVVYEYKPEDGANVDVTHVHERNRKDLNSPFRKVNRYLKRIHYGNRTSLLDDAGHRPRLLTQTQINDANWMFEVVFDYAEGHYQTFPIDAEGREYVTASTGEASAWPVRTDPFSSCRAGFEVRTYRLCRRVLMFHHFPSELGVADCLVRSTEFTYDEKPIASFITGVSQSGYVRHGNSYLKKYLPPLEFEYSEAVIGREIREVDPADMENLPYGVEGSAYQWVDLDGEGLSGVFTEQGGGWFYKRNESAITRNPATGAFSARFAPIESVATIPNGSPVTAGHWQFLDIAGDGQVDLVEFDRPLAGFYERTDDQDWQAFCAFRSLPTMVWNDPNLKFIDLTGDGHADVLITEDQLFTWYPSLAEEGFGPATRVSVATDEDRGPRIVFADGTQTISLADLSGDGLTDIVRIRNGEVCYWPNLGYGRFGAKVTMDDAPWFDSPDEFDPRRILLADTDGSGTTDIIYLGRNQTRFWFNQAGNRWSKANELPGFPPVDNIASVTVVDLMGNGTACLVWSSPLPGAARAPMKYLNLMAEGKPHLLVRTSNNLGAETRVSYAPSTYFYLRDKYDGNPWITKLPFPIHVVERVETYDRISRNRFVTRYAYHHGYFDGVEREFRGFGMVEQFDTEEFATLTADGTLSAAGNIDQASHVPPVLTKTWFHTGVYLGRDRISNFFAGLLNASDRGEYYREPGLTDAQARLLLLDDTVLPAGLSLEEEREACRALKGAMLRQEIYALDGTAKEQYPYSVIEQNFTIEAIQQRGDNLHGVFFTHPREAVTCHYERIPDDPRIAHALTLEVDKFGNVLKSANVCYSRRKPDMTLAAEDRARQAEIHVTYTENGVTNAIQSADDYRTPLPSESRTYELTGLSLSAGQTRFSLADILTAALGAAPLAYEQNPTAGMLQKRLIEHVRTIYRRNDLTGALPLGLLQSLALNFESYKLAFTPGLVNGIYGGRVNDAVLEMEGRYVNSEGDANWWIPSGRIFYSAGSTDTPAQELTYASRHFFLPRRYRNPFHTNAVSTENFVTYDTYDLLMLETRDALGNRVTVGERDAAGNLTAAGNDYRVLQPGLMTDPNRNRTAVAFDALGMVVGTAVMGKPSPAPVEGDSLTGFEADLTESVTLDHLSNPLAAPQTVLGGATTRQVYDLFAYYRTKNLPNPQPVVVYTLVRETHESDPVSAGGVSIQHSFSYSDGFGREIQKKIQAEPGPAPMRDANGKVIADADGLPQMTPNDISPRWVGSGWTVFNNKGKPVRRYEPFFTDTHHFEFDVRIGVSPVLFYDPVERVVATLHPNHTWEKVVVNPWRHETWDVNDTVRVTDPGVDPDVGDFFNRLPGADYLPAWYTRRQGGALGPQEQAAACKAAIHAGTPNVAHVDPLGRTFLIIAHNKFKYSDSPPAAPPGEEFHHTRIVIDIEGNQRAVIDARDRVVMRYDYDMLGNRIHQAGMETGERWMLSDVAGKPFCSWDSRNHRFRTAYDPLRRPTDFFLREGVGAELLVGRNVYGETRPNPEAGNLRGKVAQVFDQAGVVTSDDYDFKGNLSSIRYRLAELVDPQGARIPAYKTTLDWSGAVQLEVDIYTSRTRYDALNRPTELISPDNSVIRPGYNEANLLERVDANLRGALENGQPVWTPFVTDIDYNARGQRVLIDYGNGVRTTYEYDPLTFRPVHLLTRRNVVPFPDDCPQPPPAGWPGCQVQNLRYTSDPVGNITHISDDAQQTVYFRNRCVEPSAEYTYDAVYRLIEATGREHLGQIGGSPVSHSYNDAPRVGINWSANDGIAMGTYMERYVYDAVGNFLEMQHRGSDPLNPGWSRAYAYNETSLLEPGKQNNRLTSTTIGTTTETYSTAGNGYDAHGNMLRMPQLQMMQWDFKDQLKMSRRQAVNTADADGMLHNGERTWYVYDVSGQRVRKVTELATGQVKDERIYLGGFEVYRKNGANPLVRETLHIMDDKQRIALVETRTHGNEPGMPTRLIRYQFGNHLGSAGLELDDQGQIISYEEYSPYGSTTYQAVRSRTETPKRYRYTGKERDDESGLCYHGARYYAPWLGRWSAGDPAGLADGPNLYRYSRDNPVNLKDSQGLDPDDDDKVSLGPLSLGNFRLTGLSGGARLQLSLHGIGTSEPFSVSVNTASLAGRLSLSSSLGIPSLGLEGGTATYHLDLRDLSIADERVRADIRGRARLDTGPLSISFLTYAEISAHLDPSIIPSRWREHLQHSLESASGNAEVFATPRLLGHEVGFFALRAESGGGGRGTTSLSGRLGLGGLTLGRMHGSGTFTTGFFLGDEWVPGTYNLSGSFWAVGPGVAVGSWSFDLNRGLSASGHYLGTQFGPFGLNIGINPTGNVSDDTAYWRYNDAAAPNTAGRQGAVQMYEPGTSFGYTYFNYSSTNRFFLSVGVSPRSSVVPYYGGGASQPEIPLLGTLGVGPSPPDAGFYVGTRLNWVF